jgi:hypothetical protein
MDLFESYYFPKAHFYQILFVLNVPLCNDDGSYNIYKKKNYKKEIILLF